MFAFFLAIALAASAPAFATEGYGSLDSGSPPVAGSRNSFGSWLWDYLTVGASLTAGIGTRQAELTVTDKATAQAGTLVQRDDEAYFLSYSTRPSFLGNTMFGYTFLFNYTTIEMDRQEIEKNVYADLGTRIRGRFAYIVPTGFYQLGQHGPRGRYIRLGVGLGFGMAKYDGTIILDYPASTTPVHVANGSYDLKVAASAFLEARYRPWGVNISVAGPSYQDDAYKYNLSDIAYYLSYTYYF